MFHLRYKCYSLFSQLDGLHERPSLAECTGDPFRVYSTTSCPTLAPSTALSKVRVQVFCVFDVLNELCSLFLAFILTWHTHKHAAKRTKETRTFKGEREIGTAAC